MKLLKSLSAFVLLTATSAVAASASTITLASYGSTAATPSGVSNTATVYNGSLLGFIMPLGGGPSYNVGTGGVWATIPGASWVSNNPGNYPGGNNVEPSGSYDYSTTFMDSSASTSTGSITVLADDTAAVYLNSVLITPAAGPATAGTCDSSQPNCTQPATYVLTGFQNGLNTLTFDVLQEHGSAEGLEFAGTVTNSVTPEPSSLILMGTGLLSSTAMFYRRRVAV